MNGPPDPLLDLGTLTTCEFPEDTRLREAWLHVVSERLDPWFFLIRDEEMNPSWTTATQRLFESNIQSTLQEILRLISLNNQTPEPYLQSRQLLVAVRRLVSFTNINAFSSLTGATNDLYRACVIYFSSAPIPQRLQVCPPPTGPPPGNPPPP